MVAFVGFCGGIVKGLSPGKRTVTTCGPKAIGGGNRPGNGGLGGQSKSEPGVGKSTVLERPTQTQKAKIDPGKRYKVIIFNEVNQTRDFIVQVLLKCLPGMGESAAKEIADKAKKAGQAVVGAWIFEMAEAYCDSLRTSGLVADIQLE